MENGIWKDNIVSASEVSENYKLEKLIRKASYNKELLCTDPDCQSPILRYCHGEVKGAYFAHLNGNSCDYALFDKKDSSIVRNVRKNLYKNFMKRGYNVSLEVKILPHHYTHLLFSTNSNSKIAVEIGTRQVTASKIDNLVDEYKRYDVAVKWIVVDNTYAIFQENQTYFLKRYLLNESLNKDVIIINENCSRVSQHRIDPNKYMYNNEEYISQNYPEIYVNYGTPEELIFDENDELTLKKFNENYSEWLIKKQKAFDDKINLIKSKKIEKQQRLESKRRKYIFSSRFDYEKVLPSSREKYEQCKIEIEDKISQQEKPCIDPSGHRWVTCRECGIVGREDEFAFYGGEGQVNYGLCNACKDK